MRNLDQHFIDGEFVASHGRDAYAVNSAITGEQLAEASLGDEVDADRAVEAATRALPSWSATTLEERRGHLEKLAAAFGARREGIAGTRILAPESRIDEVRRALAEAVSALEVGDPHERGTVIGPVLDRDQYERVQGYIRAGIEEGAELLAGGEGHPDGLERGNYVKPTLFAATNDMTISREEIFGPVLSLITYRDEAEAIEIANDTPYGLLGYVAAGDVERGRRVARRIRAGRVMVNDVFGSRDAPFGGFKQSGIGREFGRYGIAAYLEPQAVFSR